MEKNRILNVTMQFVCLKKMVKADVSCRNHLLHDDMKKIINLCSIWKFELSYWIID